MRRHHPHRPFRSLVTLVVAAPMLWLLAPTAIGGRVSYVSTFGISMKPAFDAGDLVLLRRHADYHVGEVVAYRSGLLHTVIMHRIAKRQGARYVLKGDKNAWLDPEHPTKAAVLGKAWVRLPRLGIAIRLLRAFLPAALFVLGLVLVVADGTKTASRRHSSRRAPAAGTPGVDPGGRWPALGRAGQPSTPTGHGAASSLWP